MRLLDATSAEAYLRETGRVEANEPLRVRELSGGVSNMVLLVERPAHESGALVLKQARARLRTREPWFSDVERIWREAEVLRICATLVGKGQPDAPARTPEIRFEDRANFLLAMKAAPPGHDTWKSQLLSGRVDAQVAAACGTLLGTLHAESWGDQHIARRIGDRRWFDQLRIDPYYRALAAVCSEARPHVEQAIASLAAHRQSLVHADFSPKNLLVWPGGMLMVDFETGHFGDPAFDLGFFLSHLALKAVWSAPRHADYLEAGEHFRRAYDGVLAERISSAELADLWTRGVLNFALCGWARLDGKSPVEYLCDEPRRRRMRRLCQTVLERRPADWAAVVLLAASHLNEERNEEPRNSPP